MKHTSRTINPIHFEDLDPKRFEDLVRQLVYDFREWRSLEPTGRLGADDGYDARGWEIVNAANDAENENDGEEAESINSPTEDRAWMIQCKREGVITPQKMKRYLGEMLPVGADIPYGVIFASRCDFSKATRDTFRETLAQKGVKEFQLWGKADLEDQLFQPKNDHLLYAYFGFSVIVRQRGQKSKIRETLATKNKVIRHIGPVGSPSNRDVLLRDINETNYPFSHKIKDFDKKPTWAIRQFIGHYSDGIVIRTRRFFAAAIVEVGEDRVPKLQNWDYEERHNDARSYNDPWQKERANANEFRAQVWSHWDTLPKEQRAWLEIERRISYKQILAIDPHGDEYTRNTPHVYLSTSGTSLYEPGEWWKLELPFLGAGHTFWIKNEEQRIDIFPKRYKKINPTPLPKSGTQ